MIQKTRITDCILHDHVDGSLPLLDSIGVLDDYTPVLKAMYEIDNKPWPFVSVTQEDLTKEVSRLFRDPHIDIVAKFAHTTGAMQTKESIFLATMAFVAHRAIQGIRYVEFRIAPQYHTFQGLPEIEAVRAVIEGIKEAERCHPEIEANIIFSIGREVPPEESVRLVKVAAECDPSYVVGIDLVCDEASHPPEKHIPAFMLAKSLGIKRTCHAGEWVVNRPACMKFDQRQILTNYLLDIRALNTNVRTAVLKLEVNRVGHAIALAFNDPLVNEMIRRGVGVEFCPGSNLVSHIIPGVEALGINPLLCSGLKACINTDDDLFMPTIPEVEDLCLDSRIGIDKLKLMNRCAWDMRFGHRKPNPHKE